MARPVQWTLGKPLDSELPSKLSPFRWWQMFPPLPQGFLSFRREGLKPLSLFTQLFSHGWRKTAKLMEPSPNPFAFGRRQGFPLLEASFHVRSFFGSQGQPSLGSLAQAVLPLGRQLIPLIDKGFKQTPFFAT